MFKFFFDLIIGLLFIIVGVNILSKNLSNTSGTLIERLLSNLTKNIYLSFFVGTLLTALTQSSTAISLVTISLVNAKILNLTQAIGIIYGANLGTTVTAQLMSINIAQFYIVFLFVGFLLYVFTNNKYHKYLGLSIVGLGLMFLGLNVLQENVSVIKDNQQVIAIIEMYNSNPFIAVLIGTVATMFIQSSSATVGLTIVLFNEGMINLYTAIALTLGDNIGTCMTSLFASIPLSIGAKRVAWAHTLYNIFGVVLTLAFLFQFKILIEYTTFELLNQDNSKLIANSHTLFNILSALVFLPLTKYFVKFIEWMVPEKLAQKKF